MPREGSVCCPGTAANDPERPKVHALADYAFGQFTLAGGGFPGMTTVLVDGEPWAR